MNDIKFLHVLVAVELSRDVNANIGICIVSVEGWDADEVHRVGDWCRCLRCECEAEVDMTSAANRITVFFMTVSHAWRYDVGHMLEGTDRIPEGPKLTRYSTLRSSDVCVFYVLFIST